MSNFMTPAGTVYLNGIQFDIDPEDLKVLGGHRHGSAHHLVDGTTLYQDRGFDITHAVLEMSGVILNASTLASLATLYANTGAVEMSYSDWMGNAMTVIFTPGQESFSVKPIRGATSAWTYNLTLSVLSATVWNGISNPA
jgi:hypothetical protein